MDESVKKFEISEEEFGTSELITGNIFFKKLCETDQGVQFAGRFLKIMASLLMDDMPGHNLLEKHKFLKSAVKDKKFDLRVINEDFIASVGAFLYNKLPSNIRSQIDFTNHDSLRSALDFHHNLQFATDEQLKLICAEIVKHSDKRLAKTFGNYSQKCQNLKRDFPGESNVLPDEMSYTRKSILDTIYDFANLQLHHETTSLYTLATSGIYGTNSMFETLIRKSQRRVSRFDVNEVIKRLQPFEEELRAFYEIMEQLGSMYRSYKGCEIKYHFDKSSRTTQMYLSDKDCGEINMKSSILALNLVFALMAQSQELKSKDQKHIAEFDYTLTPPTLDAIITIFKSLKKQIEPLKEKMPIGLKITNIQLPQSILDMTEGTYIHKYIENARKIESASYDTNEKKSDLYAIRSYYIKCIHSPNEKHIRIIFYSPKRTSDKNTVLFPELDISITNINGQTIISETEPKELTWLKKQLSIVMQHFFEYHEMQVSHNQIETLLDHAILQLFDTDIEKLSDLNSFLRNFPISDLKQDIVEKDLKENELLEFYKEITSESPIADVVIACLKGSVTYKTPHSSVHSVTRTASDFSKLGIDYIYASKLSSTALAEFVYYTIYATATDTTAIQSEIDSINEQLIAPENDNLLYQKVCGDFNTVIKRTSTRESNLSTGVTAVANCIERFLKIYGEDRIKALLKMYNDLRDKFEQSVNKSFIDINDKITYLGKDASDGFRSNFLLEFKSTIKLIQLAVKLGFDFDKNIFCEHFNTKVWRRHDFERTRFFLMGKIQSFVLDEIEQLSEKFNGNAIVTHIKNLSEGRTGLYPTHQVLYCFFLLIGFDERTSELHVCNICINMAIEYAKSIQPITMKNSEIDKKIISAPLCSMLKSVNEMLRTIDCNTYTLTETLSQELSNSLSHLFKTALTPPPNNKQQNDSSKSTYIGILDDIITNLTDILDYCEPKDIPNDIELQLEYAESFLMKFQESSMKESAASTQRKLTIFRRKKSSLKEKRRTGDTQFKLNITTGISKLNRLKQEKKSDTSEDDEIRRIVPFETLTNMRSTLTLTLFLKQIINDNDDLNRSTNLIALGKIIGEYYRSHIDEFISIVKSLKADKISENYHAINFYNLLASTRIFEEYMDLHEIFIDAFYTSIEIEFIAKKQTILVKPAPNEHQTLINHLQRTLDSLHITSFVSFPDKVRNLPSSYKNLAESILKIQNLLNAIRKHVLAMSKQRLKISAQSSKNRMEYNPGEKTLLDILNIVKQDAPEKQN